MKPNREIVLASASPRRKELLLRAGIEVSVIPSRTEECVMGKSAPAIVKRLSRQKAEAVAASQTKGTVVIGADTVVVIDGTILGKPKDEAEAFCMLKRISGRAHSVYTGVTILLCGERTVSFHEKTDVFVYPMTEEEIRAYIETGEPGDKAGAYGIQGAFGAYVKKIRGDYTNVVGLPLGRTFFELKKLLSEEENEIK